MLRITPRRITVVVLLLIILIGSVLAWFALETAFGQQKVAEYRAWCLAMWNSGIFHIMGGLVVLGGIGLISQSGGTPRRKRQPASKGGPLGGSAFTEAMLMGEHYDDPTKRWAARKVRDIIKHGEF